MCNYNNSNAAFGPILLIFIPLQILITKFIKYFINSEIFNKSIFYLVTQGLKAKYIGISKVWAIALNWIGVDSTLLGPAVSEILIQAY